MMQSFIKLYDAVNVDKDVAKKIQDNLPQQAIDKVMKIKLRIVGIWVAVCIFVIIIK